MSEVKYAEDRPKDCRYCYFWSGKKKGCDLGGEENCYYVAYRKAGYSRKFYEAHREELTLHKAAKEAFDQLEIKKIPKVKELNAEYAEVLGSKKKTYVEYRKVRAEMQDYQIALKVAEACAGEEAEKEMLQKEQEQGQAQSQER